MTDVLLADVTDRVVEAFHPYSVILFGSHAWGSPSRDSDVDLFVVMDSREDRAIRGARVSDAAHVPYLPMDVLVYTPSEVATRIAMRDFFVLRILDRGRTLYESGRPWEQLEGHPTMTLFEEWVEKAEADFRVATRLNRSTKYPVPDAVCFHSQQCAEKFLKAVLIKHDLTPDRTHRLVELLGDCLAVEPTLSDLLPDLMILDRYSVDPRYPGFTATVEEAQEALAALRRTRKRIRTVLGL